MAVQWSTAVRDAMVGAIEGAIGTSPILEFFTGAPPATCAAADTGTKIASGTLPSDPLAGASGGAVARAGVWTVTGLPAAGAGTAAEHFRLKNAAGTVCHEQGTIGVGTGDMQLDNASIANGQVATVATHTITIGGA